VRHPMNRITTKPLIVIAMLLAGCAQSPPPRQAQVEALRGLADQVDIARMMQTVVAMVGERATDTPIDSSDFVITQPIQERFRHLTHLNSREYMAARLAALGYEVRRFDHEAGKFSSTTLVADLPGALHPEEVVVVAAHYDAFWTGADDNASGVAAVLELARIFKEQRFDRTVRFVGFDLEEIGMIGSTRWAQADLPPGGTLVGALVFDCIGYSSTQPGSQQSLPGLPSPNAGDFLAVITNEANRSSALEVRGISDALGGLKVGLIMAPGDGVSPIGGNLLRSDHAPFWLVGKPALLFTDTANFRNPHYHTDHDLPETLDQGFFRGVARLAAVTLAHWAGVVTR